MLKRRQNKLQRGRVNDNFTFIRRRNCDAKFIRGFSLSVPFLFPKHRSCILPVSLSEGVVDPWEFERTAERDKSCLTARLAAVTFPTHRLHTICVSSNAYACDGASAARKAVVAIGAYSMGPSG